MIWLKKHIYESILQIFRTQLKQKDDFVLLLGPLEETALKIFNKYKKFVPTAAQVIISLLGVPNILVVYSLLCVLVLVDDCFYALLGVTLHVNSPGS